MLYQIRLLKYYYYQRMALWSKAFIILLETIVGVLHKKKTNRGKI